MSEFEFKRRSRICSVSERELLPGEKYFSVLIDQDGEILRKEIAATEWDGPPENCVSWWQAQLPELDPNKFFWAPDHVIIDYFERFQSIEDKSVEQYVLALLLIQKRLFRLENSISDDSGVEWMSVSCAKRGSHYQVQVASPDVEEIENIENDIVGLLFSDEPFEQDLDEQNLDGDDASPIPKGNSDDITSPQEIES